MKHQHEELAHKFSGKNCDWKKLSAFATTLYALLIAISSFGIENANHHSLILKNEAVDHWAFFQAKSLKEKIYEMQSIEFELTSRLDSHYSEKQELAKSFKEEVERYENEQAEIQKKARDYTKKSEYYDRKGDFFELAQVFFELAIVLKAMFLLIERRFLFFTGAASGLVGLILIFTSFLI